MQYQFELTSDDFGTAIVTDPVGWENLSIDLKRKDDWHGIFFDYSLPLKFVFDGYDYIKTAYDLFGPFANVSLTINQRVNETYDWEVLYEGKLNFAKYKELTGKAKMIEIPMDPLGPVMQIQNKYEHKVQITPDKTLSLPPKTIIKVALADQPQPFADPLSREFNNYAFMKSCIPLCFDMIEYEDSPLSMDVTPNIFAAGDGNKIANPSDPSSQWYYIKDYTTALNQDLFVAPAGGYFRFQYNFSMLIGLIGHVVNQKFGSCAHPATGFTDIWYEFRIEVIRVGGVKVNYKYLTNYETGCFSDNVEYARTLAHTNDITLDLNPGDRVRMYVALMHGGVSSYVNFLDDSSWHYVQTAVMNQTSFLKIYFNDSQQYPASPANVRMIDQAFNDVVNNITGSALSIQSSYFGRTDGIGPEGADGCGGLECVTNGLNIRKFSQANFFLSLKELFENMSAVHNIGMGIIGDKVVVEPWDYFYQKNAIALFDSVDIMTTSFDDSMVANKLTVGYNTWETEQYNGLDEFNTKREYVNSIEFSKNEWQKVCDFIASGYAIEVTRREDVFNTSTKDFKYDNNIFLICLKRDGSGNLIVETGNIGNASNLIDPTTVYNFRLSPARIALRWGRRFLTGFRSLAGALIKFSYGDGNYKATGQVTNGCQVESGAIAENQSLSGANSILNDYSPLWSGEIVEFDIPVTKDIFQLLKVDTVNGIGVRQDDGDYIFGWIKELNFKPKPGTAKIKMIKAYDQTNWTIS